MLRSMVDLSPGAAERGLIDEFPWVDWLPLPERRQFVTDFVRAFQVSAELEQWSVLAQTVTEWRSTAAIHADPVLAQKLSGPIDTDFGPVPAPTECRGKPRLAALVVDQQKAVRSPARPSTPRGSL